MKHINRNTIEARMSRKHRRATKKALKANPGYVVVHVGANRNARRAQRAMKRRAS